MKLTGLILTASLLMTGAMPVLAQESAVLPETEQAVIAEEPVIMEEEPVIMEEAPAVIEEVPVIAEETPVIAEEAPVVTEDPEPQTVEEETEEAAELETDEELLTAEEGTPSVEYRTHVQTIGWQDYVKDGAMAGTEGKSKRLEGIKIKVSGVEGLGVEYRTHVQSIGWQEYVADDAMAGTEKQSKRLEAIQVRLTGEAAENYDIYYCVHVQTYGWLNWAKNDEIAGTAGYGKRLEGICIKIQKKGEAAPAPLGKRSVAALYGSIAYQTHVQTYGWQKYVKDGATSGTTGQSKRLEAIRIKFENPSLPGFVQYCAHIQGIGWGNNGKGRWEGTDMLSGTEGQSKRLEGIRIRLAGEIAKEYDIWYRTHVQKYGWTDWASNGTSCGSEGIGYRLEGIQIKLLPKGSPAPGNTQTTLYTTRVEDLSPADKALKKAKDYVAAITNDSMTQEQKLRICFDSFKTKLEKSPWRPGYKGQGWAEIYANSFFDLQYGDCISYAAAFAYMAKALGYTNVYGCNTGHAWVEIDGLIYDPEWDPVFPSWKLTYDSPTTQSYAKPKWQTEPGRVRIA